VGSHAIRLFVQKLEEHMAANPKQLTLDYVRSSRHGFAHGTMTGAVPDVVAAMVKYNLHLPINLRRALSIEPDNCRQNYVEACINFIGPVKTLLDAGVKVVGEGGEGSMGTSNPQVYFDVMGTYVNRRVGADGEIFAPGEAVDRVIALKLFTYRSAEFLYGENKVGSLEVGKFADFIVADKPFLSGPDSGVRDNKVLMTVIAGEERFYNDGYQPVER
jgi:predicted amidohydrolase YtcJ